MFLTNFSQKFGKRFDGEVGLWFLLLYCFNRFFIEFFAQGHSGRVADLHFGLMDLQWWCLGIFLTTFFYAVYKYYSYGRYMEKIQKNHRNQLKLHHSTLKRGV